jgi:2-methylaconitate isomerase
MSSAVGPFAIDEGLVRANGETATVRVYNTNTKKLIHATFPIEDGRTRYDGDLAIPGVSGTGAPIRLDFLDPGGATTGKLLPSGNVTDRLDVPGFGALDASLVDAANATVFVRARDIGLTGGELPAELEARPEILRLLNDIRVQGSVRMGIAPDAETARTISTVPFVAFVSPPADGATLSGDTVKASAIDFAVRVVSNGQPHRALPLTVSLCAAVAAHVPGTLVAEALSPAAQAGPLRLGMPSGVLTVGADVIEKDRRPMARAGSFYRTARRLFDGRVWVPGRVAS